ncbi:MAG: OmpA family protein [Nonlabens sp.]|uniref:OmpA family protein n=1 Tax=Nonlabens sp. TaxID=1888209 RepID=UPI003EF2D1DE
MKNILTGTLAYIVYAGMCLLLFNYLFNDSFQTTDSVEVVPEIIDEEPLMEEIVIVEDTLSDSKNSLNDQLDSIAAAKNAIDQPLLDIDQQEEMDTTAVDSITTALDESEPSQAKTSPVELTNYEANTFVIKDDKGNALTQCSTFTTIYKNNSKVKIPYTCRNYGNELKELMSGSKNAQLHINGYSSPEEDSDMGLKRAQYVKKLLTNLGIQKEQIIIKQELKKIPFKSGIAQGGVDISLTNVSHDTVNKLSKEKPQVIAPKPTVIEGTGPYGYKRFTTGYQGDSFYGNRSFTNYLKELNNYLNSNSGKKVYVYAYTDTVGNATDNYNIGKDNANTAKRLLIQNGIPASRIVAVSKGETPSGAQGNNRGMVIIVN